MKRITALVALLLLSACGSGGKGDGVATLSGGKGATPTATASADPEEAFRKFAQCMRDNGVDMPDPGGGEDGMVILAPSGAPHAVSGAEEKCRHLLKDAVREGPGKVNDPAMQDRALKFARCMREHGVDMPDPGADGSIIQKAPGGGGEDPKFDPRSPKFQAAQKQCGGLLGHVEVAGP